MTKRSLNECPEARSEGLLTENVGDELVIFDSETNEAHALKPLAAAVFAAADGNTSIEDLAALASITLGDEASVLDVEAVLTELEDSGLLVESESGGISRRRLLQVGGVAAAGAFVSSALVPALAAASTQYCLDNSLSQFAVLITNGVSNYLIVDAVSANGAVTCNTNVGGNSRSNQSCNPSMNPLPSTISVNGTPYTLSACQASVTSGVTFTATATSVSFSLPAGYTLVAWWAHGGSTTPPCIGPVYTGAGIGARTGTVNPCADFKA